MLEGATNATWWDWKDSLGPLRYRPGTYSTAVGELLLLTFSGFQGVWDYQQTHGLGLMEYLEWAEDMNMHTSETCAPTPNFNH